MGPLNNMLNNRSLFEKEDTYSLRGLCMLGIVAHHLFQFTQSRYGVHYPLPIAFPLQAAGYLASAIFFLISGYGMTLSLWRRKLPCSDAVRRILKISLPYLFFWLVCIVLISFDDSHQYTLSDLGSLVTFQLPYMGGGKWFIVSILVLYCCLMVASKMITTKMKAAELMLIMTSIYILLQIMVIHMSTIWYNSIIAFPVGVLCAAKKDCIHKYNNSRVGILLIAVFILSYLAIFAMRSLTQVTFASVELLFQILAALTFALYSVRLVSRINIQSEVLNSIGNYSLSVLIAHQVLVVYACRVSSVYAYVLIILVGTFVLTWIYSRVYRLVFS